MPHKIQLQPSAKLADISSTFLLLHFLAAAAAAVAAACTAAVFAGASAFSAAGFPAVAAFMRDALMPLQRLVATRREAEEEARGIGRATCLGPGQCSRKDKADALLLLCVHMSLGYAWCTGYQSRTDNREQ